MVHVTFFPPSLPSSLISSFFPSLLRCGEFGFQVSQSALLRGLASAGLLWELTTPELSPVRAKGDPNLSLTVQRASSQAQLAFPWTTPVPNSSLDSFSIGTLKYLLINYYVPGAMLSTK